MIYRQIIRFALVGILSNLLLYGMYLGLTHFGMGHKTAMTILYVIGVCQTFVFNQRWTFGYEGHAIRAFLAYIGLYAVGYVFNFFALYILVDNYNYDHRVVQGLMILTLAAFFFLSQKFLIFRQS